MKKALLPLLLCLLATSSLAGNAKREQYPSDYKPSPCAPDAMAVCESFPQTQITSYAATFRGFSLHQEWVDAHWDEMRNEAFRPICAKIATCYTVPGNDDVYCVDIMRDEFLATCDRFPARSQDRDQCKMFALTYFIGLGVKPQLHKPAQQCAKEQLPPGERTLEAWTQPAKIPLDHNGKLMIYAIDAETRVPVRARITVNEPGFRGTEGHFPTAGYDSKWKARLNRVPNAEGHRDVVPPTVTLTARGYETLTFPMPMDVPKMIVEIAPPADQLRRGRNTITINARDAETGKPVDARVMAGEFVLGDTNKPLQFEWRRGEKRPEIWVTSLYDHYSDVVVVKGE